MRYQTKCGIGKFISFKGFNHKKGEKFRITTWRPYQDLKLMRFLSPPNFEVIKNQIFSNDPEVPFFIKGSLSGQYKKEPFKLLRVHVHEMHLKIYGFFFFYFFLINCNSLRTRTKGTIFELCSFQWLFHFIYNKLIK